MCEEEKQDEYDKWPEPDVEYVCSMCGSTSDEPDKDECRCREHYTLFLIGVATICILFVVSVFLRTA